LFGVRSEADAEQTKKTLPMLRELYRRERSRVPVKMKLEIEEGGEKLTVTDADGSKAFAYGDAEPQPARTDPTESLHRSLAKTGGTPFAVEDQDITVEMETQVPARNSTATALRSSFRMMWAIPTHRPSSLSL